MGTAGYWRFTLLFWLAAGLLMFASTFTGEREGAVLMRLLYFPVLGLALTGLMTLVFGSERFSHARWTALWAIVLSALAAVVTGMILNPITYLVLGIDLLDDHLRKMTTGVVGFAATYLFWCVLYFELDGRPLLGSKPLVPETGHLAALEVDDRGETRMVDTGEIECLAASGDYVEIQLAERTFLRKATITSMLSVLDPERFRRVHRSTVINVDRVVAISPRGGSGFEIELAAGRKVVSSRSYRAVVDGIAAALAART